MILKKKLAMFPYDFAKLRLWRDKCNLKLAFVIFNKTQRYLSDHREGGSTPEIADFRTINHTFFEAENFQK